MTIKPFKLENYFEKYEFNVPYVLCESDCESFTIKDLLKLTNSSIEEFHELYLGYTQTKGNPFLREEISKLYSSISSDEILVHSGAEEAIFNVMNVLLKKGDHLIIHYPCYQSLIEIPKSIGCEITKWKSNEKDGWGLDIDLLIKSIKHNTKLIIINCPHNPTGYLMEKEKYSKLIEIAKQRKIFIFSDEVYRFLEYNSDDRLPSSCDIYNNAISLGVMSKSFGLAGLRIGWIATKNPSLLSKVRSFKDYTTICNSAPAEYLSTIALKNKDKIFARNLKIINDNLVLLDKFFKKYEETFKWIKPKAGAIAFPKLNKKISINKFCLDLIQKKGVLLLPGNLYDYKNNYFRIGFGRKNMPRALRLLDEYMKEFW